MSYDVTTDIINITSVDEGSQDTIIDKTGMLEYYNKNVTIQVKETNNKQARIQPWYAIMEPNAEADWVKIQHSEAQDYWELPPNGNKIVAIDNSYGFLWFRLTGWLASAGTAKVQAALLAEK